MLPNVVIFIFQFMHTTYADTVVTGLINYLNLYDFCIVVQIYILNPWN